MGWDSSSAWRHVEDVVAEIIRATRPGVDIAAQRTLGRDPEWRVWTLYEQDGRRYIVLDLIERRADPRFPFARKSIHESEGPYYWDCPAVLVRAADGAGPAPTQSAAEWRAQVLRRQQG